MFTRILVPLDGSDYSAQVLGAVTPLAKRLGASVHLLHVADISILPLDGEMGYQPYIDRLVEDDLQQAGAYLPDMEQRLKSQGIDASSSAVQGTPADTILSTAADQHCDLIAMATHGRSGIARVVLGSVAEKVLNHATVPLLLYRPREGDPAELDVKSVCVSLDGTAMAEQALSVAQDIASKLAVPLVAVRAVPTYLQVFDTTDPVLITDALEAMERDAAAYLAEVKERLEKAGMKVETHFEKGYAANAIVQVSENAPDSLLVMSSHGRSGLGRMVLGSVTDEVVRTSTRPVLVVRAK